jgi:hypothetical protein
MSINWLITVIASIIGSIFLSIVGNLLTDPVKNWFAQRSLISKRKRVDVLRQELHLVERLASDDRALSLESNLTLARSLLLLFWAMAAGIYGTASLVVSVPAANVIFMPTAVYDYVFYVLFFLLAILAAVLGGILFILGTRGLWEHYNLIRRIKNIENYRREAQKRIQELS